MIYKYQNLKLSMMKREATILFNDFCLFSNIIKTQNLKGV